jgi:hypothetical protein
MKTWIKAYLQRHLSYMQNEINCSTIAVFKEHIKRNQEASFAKYFEILCRP